MDALMERDERERMVDQAADRLSYVVISFGLLAIVAYRSFVHGEAPLDLMGLVILGGLVGTAYRTRRRAISRRWVLVTGLVVAVALVLAALVAFAR